MIRVGIWCLNIVASAWLALVMMYATAFGAASTVNTSVGMGVPSTPQANIATEQRVENGSTRDLDRIIIEQSWLRNAKAAQMALDGPVGTPMPWGSPTPTAIGASPTPTPGSFKECWAKANDTNTATVWLGECGVVTTTAGGFELGSGDYLGALPAKDGDCGGYCFATDTAGQTVSKGMK